MATKSVWADTLDAKELAAHYDLTASIDPTFASSERAFYESRTAAELACLVIQAWNCNTGTSYQLARSYLALGGGL